MSSCDLLAFLTVLRFSCDVHIDILSVSHSQSYFCPATNTFYCCPHRLQKFKMSIANTVIGADNSSLNTMSTDQLLDLFTLDPQGKAAPGAGVAGGSGSGVADGGSYPGAAEQGAAAGLGGSRGRSGVKAVLDSLEELWDEGQYEAEYSLQVASAA